MDTQLLSEALQTIGEVIIGLTVIMVHHKVIEEHKIDKKVFLVMKREQLLGGFGILLIILGFMLKLPFFY